jgi:mono/diheme cytochrome c family protein
MAEKKKGRLKRALLFTGVGFVGFVALAYGGVYFGSQSKLNAQVEQAVHLVEIPDSNAAVERGKYLVDHVMGCSHSDCHRADLGGGTVIDAPPMGMLYAPNITTGKGSVIKDFEPIDFVRIIRHGIKKDGRRAVVMPSEDYWNFPDSDIGAVIAYVKSMPPVDRETRDHEPGFLARALLLTGEIKFAHEKIDHSAERPMAQPGPTKEWGAVLIGTCIGCHGEGLSGGKIPGGDPEWPESRNITPDEATGIGKWDYATFTKALREGTRPDGTKLNPLMPWQAYKGMEEDDVRAVWEYLRSVPAKPAGGR